MAILAVYLPYNNGDLFLVFNRMLMTIIGIVMILKSLMREGEY
jgi:hypothetical protein